MSVGARPAAGPGRRARPPRASVLPGLASLDPRAARWIGAFIRMTSPHPAMTRILDVVERLQDRPYRTNFVLAGEAGTGKEGLARALHQLAVGDGPVVRLDVAGLPDEEALALLCGTGRAAGLGAEADGGSLMIEETAALGPRTQLALLRLLKAGRCEPLGARTGGRPSNRTLRVSAIALTDRDLPGEVASGRFRHDLYWRLARVVLWLPPLRDRIDDLGPSAVWMGNRILRAAGIERDVRTTEDLRSASPAERAAAVELRPDAVQALGMHSWPGNFRELEAVLERALLMFGDGRALTADHVRAALAAPDGR